MDTLAESRKRTVDRFNRRNALKAKNRKRRRIFCATPHGRAVTADLFIGPLAQFLDGELDDKPFPPPGDLANAIALLDPQTLALAVLAPLLDSIMRGWRGRETASAEMRLHLKIGRYLCDRIALAKLQKSKDKAERKLAREIRQGRKPAWKFLKPEWDDRECVAAGFWLAETALSLDYFTLDDRGFPTIAPEWQADLAAIHDELQWREPYTLPHTKPLPDWRGWYSEYDDRLRVPFVRDWHPETRARFTEAFNSGNFEHANGVNAVRRVSLKINQRMLPLVEKFSVEVMGHTGDQRLADARVVAADLSVAKFLNDQPFYLDYNCDTRGRVHPVSHFNYAREDHCRSLFNFFNGMLIGRDGVQWLELHCAGCEGSTSKEEWAVRWRWIDANKSIIERIARDPVGTFDIWRKADQPFCFVAACMELSEAWADPIGFVTHLPVGFDATCSGIQHLALLPRDRAAGKLVNLTSEVEFSNDGFKPYDVYTTVIIAIWTALELDDDPWAAWWRGRLRELEPRQWRKLLKRPVMTFAYSATDTGMADAITEVYRDLFELNEPEKAAARYLAKKVRSACKRILPGPAQVMEYIRKLAKVCADRGNFLESVTPTGFRVSNRYEVPNVKRIYLTHDAISINHMVADGSLPKPNNTKALNAAAPNFVHSLDAAHLIKTVLAARRERINDVLVIHDCFACLAPQANRFREIVRTEMANMYEQHDPLRELHERNIGNAKLNAPPRFGTLRPREIEQAHYSFDFT